MYCRDLFLYKSKPYQILANWDLRHGFDRIDSTVLFFNVFVGRGDSTHPPANLIFP